MYDPDAFVKGVILDALAEGMRATWERRALGFLDARPRHTDFNGNATPQQIVERYERCTEVAAACPARAALARMYPTEFGIDRGEFDDIASVLDEEAS
jgi:hypothetical protein